jgi:hypothetical protein
MMRAVTLTRQPDSDVAARREITAALLRYCEGVDRIDEGLIRSAYHPDAWDDHGVYCGPIDGFVSHAVTALPRRLSATTHCLSNIQIEINGNRAAVQSYLQASHLREHAGEPRVLELLGGRYLDLFERRDEWRIAYRRLIVDWHVELPASVMPSGDRYRPGSRSKDDERYGLFAAVQEGRSWPVD